MTRKLLIAAVLTALAASGAAAAPAPLPLAAGNTWWLADDTSGRETVVTVRSTARGLALRGFPGLSETRVRRSGSAIEAWDERAGRWEPFLRLGAPRGTRYTVDLAADPLWRGVQVTVASRAAAVRDARGRLHRGCVRLVLTPPKGVADAGVEELVFAPGTGLVRAVVTTIAGPRELLLRRFAAGATS